MKKAGWRYYLNEDEESLVIASDDIEGVQGLPLDCRGVAENLQKVVKTVKYWCVYYDIL